VVAGRPSLGVFTVVLDVSIQVPTKEAVGVGLFFEQLPSARAGNRKSRVFFMVAKIM